MYHERRARVSSDRSGRRAHHVPQRPGARELRPAHRGRLRPPVRRPQLRTRPSALRRRAGDVDRRGPHCLGRPVLDLGGAGAVGNHVARGLLARACARAVIAGSAAVAALGTLSYVFAGETGVLMIGTSVFGLGIGAASTRGLHRGRRRRFRPEARGAGFGLLSTGSLIGLATSPIICGLLGTLSLRAVFVLDYVCADFRGGSRPPPDGDCVHHADRGTGDRRGASGRWSDCQSRPTGQTRIRSRSAAECAEARRPRCLSDRHALRPCGGPASRRCGGAAVRGERP